MRASSVGQPEKRMLVLEAGLDPAIVWELGLVEVGGREFPSDLKSEECVSLQLTLDHKGEGAWSESTISASPRDEAKAYP